EQLSYYYGTLKFLTASIINDVSIMLENMPAVMPSPFLRTREQLVYFVRFAEFLTEIAKSVYFESQIQGSRYYFIIQFINEQVLKDKEWQKAAAAEPLIAQAQIVQWADRLFPLLEGIYHIKEAITAFLNIYYLNREEMKELERCR